MTPMQALTQWDEAVKKVMAGAKLNKSRASDALMATPVGAELFALAKGARGLPEQETDTEAFLKDTVGVDELARLRQEHSKRAATRFRDGVNHLVATGMSRSQASAKVAQDMGDAWRDAKDARGVL